MGLILSYLYYKKHVFVSDDDGEVFSDLLYTTESRYSKETDNSRDYIYDYYHIRPRSIHLFEDYNIEILNRNT